MKIAATYDQLLAENADLKRRLENAEKAQQQSELILEYIIEQMPAGIIITDASGTVARNNQEMDLIWRRHMFPTEYIDDHNYTALHANGDEYQNDEWPLSRAIKNGEVIRNEEMLILRGDGSYGTVLVSAAPVRDKSGKVVAAVVVDVDITTQQLQEYALQDSERRCLASERQARQHLAELEAIYNSAPVGLCVLDTDMRFKRLNQRFAEINGVSVQDHIGRTPAEIVPTLGRQAEIAMHTILNTGQPLMNLRISGETVAAPGEIRNWNENWVPIRDAEGRITGINITAEEITDQIKAAAVLELHHSEQRFNKAFDSSPVMMSIMDLTNGRYIDVNQAWLRHLNYERGEVVGKSVFELNTLADKDCQAELYQHWKDRVKIDNKEIELLAKDGSLLTCLVSTEFINLGGRLCSLANIVDITARKQAETKLQASEQKFHHIFHYTPSAMALLHMADNTIVDVNGAWTNLTGISRTEALGKSVVELGLWAEPEQRQPYMEAIYNQGRADCQELKLNTRHGIKEVLESGYLFEFQDQVYGLSTMIDISPLRGMERELARLDRLNLVGEMAASIGHEVRNPMTSVRGFLQMFLLQDEYARDFEYLNLMIEELDRANSIVTNFLALAGNRAVDFKPSRVNQIVNDLAPLISADARIFDQDIELRLDEVPAVMVDVNEIRQLVMNLARNGFEAMDAGGVLTIGTGCQGNRVVLTVSDQGCGIGGDILQRLGTPFVTSKQDGTGLGLAVCYSIAHRHGAKIEVETGPGGTTFMVIFNK